MRILYCIPSLGGGGAERQIVYLSKELKCRDWDVHVAFVSGGPNINCLKSSGAVIHKLTARNNYDPLIFCQLLRTIRKVKPDLIQVWLTQMEILGGVAAEIFGVPWIFSERSSMLAYPPSLKNRLRAFIASRANAIISNSKGGDQYWQTRVNSRVPRYVIPNALRLEEIDGAKPVTREQIGLKPEQRVVMYLGRFHPHKNLETLLISLSEVLVQPDIVAVLCGDGPLFNFIEQRLKAYKIYERVLLPGYVLDIWNWIKLADVFVSVSLFEGHPNTVIEAMASGCPLVVSDIPAHREFLDEQSALFVNPGAPNEIAQAIGSVLRSRNQAERRAQNARVKIKQYSIQAVAQRYDQVYKEILKRCKKSNYC